MSIGRLTSPVQNCINYIICPCYENYNYKHGMIFMHCSGVITFTCNGICRNFATFRAFSKSGESAKPTENAVGMPFTDSSRTNRVAIAAINELNNLVYGKV